jgi:hypothetical protein
MNTFEKLVAPLKTFLEGQGNKIDKESGSKSLFFSDFTLKMIYAIIMQIPSLRMLITELATSPTALNLGFRISPYSTFRDGFSRFAVHHFRKLFLHVLKSYDWIRLDAIDEVGIVKLVDGSLFPTLASMYWATYKKKKNAIRLHLEFELNRMVPTEFIAQKANSSERSFLLSILTEGYTYVADRGYFSFKMANAITGAKAFFIMRIKGNFKFNTLSNLGITSSKPKIPECFSQISDRLIRFENDQFEQQYRLISFNVLQSHFLICSNRFDLTTMQIIMLYAYRWQVELMFKFLKRTMKGIHLFNNSQNGVMIQFYLFMIVALLKLRLMQVCQRKTQQVIAQKQQLEDMNDYFGVQPERWIKTIAIDFYTHWKIGIHWIRTLINLIDHHFDENVILKLAQQ